MTERYQRLDGTITNGADPQRGVWYSNRCSYWTDEWDRLLALPGGLPVCPYCGSPGFQTEWSVWMGPELDSYELMNPGYRDQLLAKRNTPCRSLAK